MATDSRAKVFQDMIATYSRFLQAQDEVQAKFKEFDAVISNTQDSQLISSMFQSRVESPAVPAHTSKPTFRQAAQKVASLQSVLHLLSPTMHPPEPESTEHEQTMLKSGRFKKVGHAIVAVNRLTAPPVRKARTRKRRRSSDFELPTEDDYCDFKHGRAAKRFQGAAKAVTRARLFCPTKKPRESYSLSQGSTASSLLGALDSEMRHGRAAKLQRAKKAVTRARLFCPTENPGQAYSLPGTALEVSTEGDYCEMRHGRAAKQFQRATKAVTRARLFCSTEKPGVRRMSTPPGLRYGKHNELWG